jgi:hypothetical protein
VVATVIAVITGTLSVALLVAHFTQDAAWMRGLDERIYASKWGLLFPGGWMYRLGMRHGDDGARGWSAYDLGRRRSTVSPVPELPLEGGEPPRMPDSLLVFFEEPIPVEPSGRRRAR